MALRGRLASTSYPRRGWGLSYQGRSTPAEKRAPLCQWLWLRGPRRRQDVVLQGEHRFPSRLTINLRSSRFDPPSPARTCQCWCLEGRSGCAQLWGAAPHSSPQRAPGAFSIDRGLCSWPSRGFLLGVWVLSVSCCVWRLLSVGCASRVWGLGRPSCTQDGPGVRMGAEVLLWCRWTPARRTGSSLSRSTRTSGVPAPAVLGACGWGWSWPLGATQPERPMREELRGPAEADRVASLSCWWPPLMPGASSLELGEVRGPQVCAAAPATPGTAARPSLFTYLGFEAMSGKNVMTDTGGKNMFTGCSL